MPPTLRAVDFFCGAGGMTNGLLKAGIDVIAGVDNHLPCFQTYQHATNNLRPNGSPSRFLHEDINSLTADKLLTLTKLKRRDDNLVFAGCSPCQFWSKVNTDKNKSAQGKRLLDHFKELVLDILPAYVVVENVPGLATRAEDSGLEEFRQSLRTAALPYRIAEGVVPVAFHGVPQKRKRYTLIATRLPGDITLPEATVTAGAWPEDMTVKNFLGSKNGFASISAGHKDISGFHHSTADLQPQNLERIRLTEKNGGKRSAWSNNPALMIPAYVGRDKDFPDIYGRMSWDEPAPTITTKFNSISNGRFGHPEEDRAISLREGATLQTFPKDYAFVGTQGEIARQIGNAVPPELARRIGHQLLTHWTANQH
jgi:DNA (cytosine-5)-methyltransferase 1